MKSSDIYNGKTKEKLESTEHIKNIEMIYRSRKNCSARKLHWLTETTGNDVSDRATRDETWWTNFARREWFRANNVVKNQSNCLPESSCSSAIAKNVLLRRMANKRHLQFRELPITFQNTYLRTLSKDLLLSSKWRQIPRACAMFSCYREKH